MGFSFALNRLNRLLPSCPGIWRLNLTRGSTVFFERKYGNMRGAIFGSEKICQSEFPEWPHPETDAMSGD
jgi:hypothetical protein